MYVHIIYIYIYNPCTFKRHGFANNNKNVKQFLHNIFLCLIVSVTVQYTLHEQYILFMERWFGGKNHIERTVKHFPILSNNVQPHIYIYIDDEGGGGRSTRVPSSSIQLYFSLSLVNGYYFFLVYHCAQRIPLLYKYGPGTVHYYTFPSRTSRHTI